MKLTTKRLCGLLCLFAVILAVAYFAPNENKVAAASAKTVTVQFMKFGGSGTVTSRTYTVGKTYGSLPTGPTLSKGMEFTGWYTQAFGGTRITTGTKVSASYTTLYAHYKSRTFLIKFNTQGGTDGYTSMVYPFYVSYGAKYGLLPPSTKPGYTFIGWYTAATGGKRIWENTLMLTAADHTLYAHWEKVKHMVSSEEGGIKVLVPHGDTYTLPSVPGHPGWTWEIHIAGTNAYKSLRPGQKITVNCDLTLKAVPSGNTGTTPGTTRK